MDNSTQTIKYDPQKHKECIERLKKAISGREKEKRSKNDTIDIYWKVPMLAEYVSTQISLFNRMFLKGLVYGMSGILIPCESDSALPEFIALCV